MYIAFDLGMLLPIAIPGVEQNIPKLALAYTIMLKKIIIQLKNIVFYTIVY